MNKLISQPFELQLNTWFESVVERVCGSGAICTRALETLTQLRKRKESLLEQYRVNGSSAQTLHLSLTTQVAELLESVEAAEGPTEFAWLNRPVQKIRAFLAGCKLDTALPQMMAQANERAQSLIGAGSLRSVVRTLLLWSEGHLVLSGLEVRRQLERLVMEAHKQGNLEEQELGLEDLLTLCAHSEGAEQQEYLLAFEATLEQWEIDFAQLDEQVVTLLGSETEIFDPSIEAYEQLQDALHEDLSWGELSMRLSALRENWESACALVLPLVTVRAHEASASDRAEHLDSLMEVVAGFQGGTVSQAQLELELQSHQSRWGTVAPQLRSAWNDSPQKLALLNSVDLSLQTLATVNSPGDARLAPVAQLYCHSLQSLLNQEL